MDKVGIVTLEKLFESYNKELSGIYDMLNQLYNERGIITSFLERSKADVDTIDSWNTVAVALSGAEATIGDVVTNIVDLKKVYCLDSAEKDAEVGRLKEIISNLKLDKGSLINTYNSEKVVVEKHVTELELENLDLRNNQLILETRLNETLERILDYERRIKELEKFNKDSLLKAINSLQTDLVLNISNQITKIELESMKDSDCTVRDRELENKVDELMSCIDRLEKLTELIDRNKNIIATGESIRAKKTKDHLGDSRKLVGEEASAFNDNVSNDLIKSLYAKGLSPSKIADELNNEIGEAGVRKRLKQMKIFKDMRKTENK